MTRSPALKFFRTAAELRSWFRKHHSDASELWVGFRRKSTGLPSITWPESVDEALCVGWIDGLRKGIDETSYRIRFTPRKPSSIWSSINIGRARQLIEEGRMRPDGLKAFQARRENRSGIYAYEQRTAELPEQYARALRRNGSARRFFDSQPASYRKQAMWWVVSAKREETRRKRLEKLIAHSAKGERLPQYVALKRSPTQRSSPARSHGARGGTRTLKGYPTGS